MEDFVVIIAGLPWRGGLVAALVTFLVLHHFALKPGTPVTGPAGINNFAHNTIATMVGTVAYFAQFLVPFLCLFAAAISAWKARERTGLVATVANSSASSLNEMSWVQFERLVGEGFRLQGYTVAETGGVGAPDGGVDVVLKRGSETFLVQCKQWRRSRSVSTWCASSTASWLLRAPPAASSSRPAPSRPTRSRSRLAATSR